MSPESTLMLLVSESMPVLLSSRAMKTPVNMPDLAPVSIKVISFAGSWTRLDVTLTMAWSIVSLISLSSSRNVIVAMPPASSGLGATDNSAVYCTYTKVVLSMVPVGEMLR